ncbi:hypothetical protein [Peribacillus frigoritolerans]|uniref:hypothetical protein n=1 Tax=Peribacillus frigoritolerans TaxID=450367 RepID=UPI00105A35A9|nr:hypothetical protein [Peribacillus frigoritolerans]TDL76456.1 hypothetical protein E2R53_19945 [Peribacillus frigoritolerans]
MKKMLAGIIFASLFSLLACSMNEEEMQTATIDQTKKTFTSKPAAANEESGTFNYHLPEGYKVESAKNNNLIFKRDDDQYILFVNDKEKEDSTVFYDSLLEQYKDPIVEETFKENGRFGYVLVDKLKDDEYEVSAGIGGVKMTTQTNGRNVADTAEQMMGIVSSVTY